MVPLVSPVSVFFIGWRIGHLFRKWWPRRWSEPFGTFRHNVAVLKADSHIEIA